MSFLYPFFLFFIGLIAIPIIIHLFHFRKYKIVYFSSLQFLINVAKETKSKNKLKHLLILLARILTILCLVLAFSQPFIPAKIKSANTKREIIALYIDNSFSMDAEGTNGNLLEEAKNNALEIALAYPPSNEFLLITNDFEPKHQHLINRDQLTDYISTIHSSPRNTTFSSVIERTKQLAQQSEFRNAVINLCILSDFQKYNFNSEVIQPDSLIRFMLFPSIPLSAKNLSIDSCWFDYPNHNFNQQEKLQVRIRNYSEESYQNIPVKLYVNDTVKTLASFSIDKNASETITLSYSNISKGTIHGKVEITDYPITYDNVYYFNYDVIENLKILSINGSISFNDFAKLFNTDSLFKFDEMSEKNINYSILPSHQVVILNGLSTISSGLLQEVQSYISKGGSVVFIPDLNAKPSDYLSFFNSYGINIRQLDTSKSQVSVLNDKAPFFKNVFQNIEENPQLPFINKHFSITISPSYRYDNLFLTRNNDPLFSAIEQQKGKLYLFTFSFQEKITNFMIHPLFIPVFYRIASLSTISSELSYIISSDLTVSIPNIVSNNDEIVELKNHQTKESFIPEQQKGNSEILIFPGNQIISDGSFDVMAKENISASLSFNYNRNESFPDYYSSEEFKNILDGKGFKTTVFDNSNSETIASKITSEAQGKPLWKYFIWLTLLFIAAEIALVRFLK